MWLVHVSLPMNGVTKRWSSTPINFYNLLALLLLQLLVLIHGSHNSQNVLSFPLLFSWTIPNILKKCDFHQNPCLHASSFLFPLMTVLQYSHSFQYLQGFKTGLSETNIPNVTIKPSSIALHLTKILSSLPTGIWSTDYTCWYLG